MYIKKLDFKLTEKGKAVTIYFYTCGNKFFTAFLEYETEEELVESFNNKTLTFDTLNACEHRFIELLKSYEGELL